MHRPAFVVTCLLLAVAPMVAQAQTNNSYPMLMSVRPAAAQVGQTTECEVSARYNLHGANQVIISGGGVIGEVVQPEKKPDEKPPATKPNVPKIKVRFTVAADAVPGVRDFRLITPQGATTVGQLVIARDAVVIEAADNDVAAKAQVIMLPATVCGVIEKAEDLDYYKFKVEAGTAYTFHVRSQRLENRIHDMQVRVDPLITLRSATGGTLATSDNFYAGDPLLYHKFEQAGEYLLEIRDVRYQGNADWVYSIEINTRPFVTQVFPLAVVPGVETKLSLVGFNIPADPTAAVTIPATTEPGIVWVSPPVGGQPANSFPVFVTTLPLVMETPVENTSQATAQAIPVPSVVNGRIESPSDADYYTFEAKAGEKFSFEVFARRAQSSLDSFLRILNDKGAPISEADDQTYNRLLLPDSQLENFTAPADGKYTIEIRDLHLRGGAQFTYALQTTRAQPYFKLEIDTDKTLLAPGISTPIYVRVGRRCGYVGEVQLAIEGLPAGVTAVTGRILANGNDGCIILQTAANAPFSATNIRVTGTGEHIEKDKPPLKVSAVAVPMQEVYSPGGGRAHYPVEIHTVSVEEPMDIRSVKLSKTDIVLKQGESQKIEVTIERAPGFKGNVTMDILYQHFAAYGDSVPKGVTIDGGNSRTLLTGEETKGFITLKAAADAPAVEKQLIPVMTHVSVNFVMKMTYCGEPVYITVLPPAPK